MNCSGVSVRLLNTHGDEFSYLFDIEEHEGREYDNEGKHWAEDETKPGGGEGSTMRLEKECGLLNSPEQALSVDQIQNTLGNVEVAFPNPVPKVPPLNPAHNSIKEEGEH